MAAATEHVLNTPAGQVSYVESGEGSPVVILHSLLTDRSAFDGVVDEIGGRVIRPDLPGFGTTTTASPEIETYAERITTRADGVHKLIGRILRLN